MATGSHAALWRGLGWAATAFALPLVLAPPAAAQFSGLLRSAPRDSANAAQASGDCPSGKKRSTGSRVLGGLLGSVAGSAARSIGIASWVPIPAVADQLTGVIACRLDPKEQQQAAEATLQATRSVETQAAGEAAAEPVAVGSSAQWVSETRPEVSGRSTVSARQASADGADCITVTDVVIIKGEETTADKRMCRPPGSRRYSLVA